MISVPNSVVEERSRPQILPAILSLSHVERDYRRGGEIFGMEDPATHLYAVVQGRVKILRASADGHQKILAVHHRGGLFGEQALEGHSQRQNDAAIALEHSRIAAIRIEDFWRVARQNPALAQTVLQSLSAHLSAAHRQIESLAFEPNDRRLARALYDLGSDATSAGAIRLTHEELAELIGASRETVTNLMIRLRRQGLIEYKRGEARPHLPKLAQLLANHA